MSQRRRALLLVGILGLGAVGCELIVDFDRSKIDGGEQVLPDGAPVEDAPPGADVTPHPDANGPDANGIDATLPDGGDAAVPDSNAPDSSDANAPDTSDSHAPDAADSHAPDANGPDTSVTDANGPDTNLPDTNLPDTNLPDTNGPDTNGPDTNLPDTNLPDTNLPDTNLPDTDVPDTNGADSACNALDPSPATAVTSVDSTAAAPATTGGVLPTSGTWFLTGITYYVGDGGASGHAGETSKAVAAFSGSTIQLATLAPATSTQAVTQTFAVSAVDPVLGTYLQTPTCGGGAPGPVRYSVVGPAGAGQQLIVTPDQIEYETFTQQ